MDLGSPADVRSGMKASELKHLLADVPDDTEIVSSGSDHSYRKVSGAKLVKAEVTGNKSWGGRPFLEYWDDANKSNAKAPVIDVFWIG